MLEFLKPAAAAQLKTATMAPIGKLNTFGVPARQILRDRNSMDVDVHPANASFNQSNASFGPLSNPRQSFGVMAGQRGGNLSGGPILTLGVPTNQ